MFFFLLLTSVLERNDSRIIASLPTFRQESLLPLLLLNALVRVVTGERVIFLGDNWLAARVSTAVMCCPRVSRDLAFPYANQIKMANGIVFNTASLGAYWS